MPNAHEPIESLYPCGYSICTYESKDLPFVFDVGSLGNVLSELKFYQDLFESPPTSETVKRVSALFADGEPMELASEADPLFEPRLRVLAP